jgi:proteasome lid subunit RPN8/RPN11
MEEMLERLVENDPAGIQDWNLWLHSHHGMQTFRSGTDVAQRNGFKELDVNHFFSIVTSHG